MEQPYPHIESDPAQVQAEAAAFGPGRSLWGDAAHKLRTDRVAMLCLAVIAVYAAAGLGALVYEPLAARGAWGLVSFSKMADYSIANQWPSWSHWLGTDWKGRDILFKTVLGVRVSLTVGLMANIMAVPLGMVLGALAGFYGRWIDAVITWLYSTLSSIPGIILLIALKFTFNQIQLGGITGVYIALAVVSWIGTCRLVRAETLKLRELDYVLAARASGRGSLGILVHHILPNVFHLGVIQFSLGFVGAIGAEVILSYLGLGVDVGQVSWGTMINSARLDLQAGRPWELTAATGAMFILVLALNLFGDRLRDALDPKLRNV